MREKCLPADIEAIAKLIRMREHTAVIRDVLNEFFVRTEEGYAHAKCEEVIAAVHSKRTKAQASAAKRWDSERNANAMPTQCEGNAPSPSPSPSPITQEEEKTPRKRVVAPCPADVDAAIWDDYLAVRKAKRAGPVTDTVLTGLRREAERAGIALSEAVRACAEYGWQGFDAKWYAERMAKTTVAKAKGESFAEQSARLARERVSAFAPGVAAVNNNLIEVFDVPAIGRN